MSSRASTPLRHPVVVTGASTGIGRATTERLARAGTPVIAGVRKQADYDALAAIPGVEPVILDVTKADDVAALDAAFPVGAAAGARYPADVMKFVDPKKV